MDKEELKKFTDAADQKIKELEQTIEAKADIEGLEKLEKLQAEISEKISAALKIEDKSLIEYAKESQSHLDSLEEKVNKFVEGIESKGEHPEVTIDKFLKSDEWKDGVKTAMKGERPNIKVLTVGTDLVAGNNAVILPERVPGVDTAPRADTPLYNLVRKGTTIKDKVSWIERTLASESHGTAMKAENAAFGESDAAWLEVDAAVKKITDSFRATNESLEDTDFVRSEILDMLQNNIPHLRETQLLSGTNLTVNMNGINTAAKAFSLPTGVDAVADPNNFDVLKAAILQVYLGYNGTDAYKKGYVANAIVLNPVDALNMELVKDANNNYLLPTFISANGMNISGVPVIKSTDQTAGTFTVADLSAVTYYTRRGMQVKFWDQYDTDPAYDRVMFTASERGCIKISNIAAYALVTGTFAAGKLAMTP